MRTCRLNKEELLSRVSYRYDWPKIVPISYRNYRNREVGRNQVGRAIGFRKFCACKGAVYRRTSPVAEINDEQRSVLAYERAESH